MKTGKTLVELATELTRQAETKRDFIAPAAKIEARAERDHGALVPTIALRGENFTIRQHAHGQIATYAAIPRAYYDRMLADAPELWAVNVNEWMTRSNESRMVRTLDGSVRALLSDRYRPLENFDFANAILPAMQQIAGLEIASCDVTETRLYIKAIDPTREEKIERAFSDAGLKRLNGRHDWVDVISPAATASNSEVGAGALAISVSLYCKACTNLAVFEGGDMRRYHVGKRADVSAEVYAMLTDETRERMDQAIWMQVRDVTASAFNPDAFRARVEKLREATEDEIKIDVTEVGERVQKQLGLRETEAASMLDHLIRGGDFTRYGLHNAVTRTAQDIESYDRASELEKLGGRIIELPAKDWTTLAVTKKAA
jgi:hypothetical protein